MIIFLSCLITFLTEKNIMIKFHAFFFYDLYFFFQFRVTFIFFFSQVFTRRMESSRTRHTSLPFTNFIIAESQFVRCFCKNIRTLFSQMNKKKRTDRSLIWFFFYHDDGSFYKNQVSRYSRLITFCDFCCWPKRK